MMRQLTHAEINELTTDAELLVLALRQAKSGWEPVGEIIFDVIKHLADVALRKDVP
jgi:hypothetical protein